MGMDIITIIIGVLILAGMVSIYFSLRKGSGNMSIDKDLHEKMVRLEERIAQLHQQSGELTKTVDLKLADSTRAIQAQFGESAKIVQQVTEKLTRLDETNRQVVGFADQLRNLQDILKNPKQRGVLGEYYLETLLKNVMPPNAYQMQYKFQDGEIVDAVVFVKDKIIPVDSKFSLENYNRMAATADPSEHQRLEKVFVNDLKLRITETAKYVRPNEGTMDFAFMFIPHEAIYYDLLINKVGAVAEDTENLIQRAAGKYHVIIVSPTSFLAYLQTVLQGLRAMQIEESAKEIRQNVELLSKHLSNYDTYMQKLGQHLGTTVSSYNFAYKEFKKVDKDMLKIAEVGGSIEPLEVAKPKDE